MYNFFIKKEKDFSLLLRNILILTASFFIITLFLFYSLRTIFYQYNVNISEGQVLTLSMMLYEKGNYFLNISNYPFMHGAYPPVYPFIVSIFLHLTGPSFMIGRMISFIATVVIVCILYKLFFQESQRNKEYSLLLSVLFLAPFFVVKWSSIFRVDMLAVCFSFLGIYFYIFYNEKKSNLRFISVIFFILAFYTKQNAIAAPMAILIYNILRNRKECIKFLILYSIPLLSIFLLINYATRGEFYLHLIKYTYFIGLSISRIPGSYQIFLKEITILFILFLINIIFIKKNYIYSLYFIISYLLLFTITKPGADTNYYIEPFLSLLIISGLTFLHLIKLYDKKIYNFSLVFLMVFQAFILFGSSAFVDLIKNPFLPANHKEIALIHYYAKNIKGTILSEDLGFLAINNKPLFLESFQMAWLEKFKLWSSEKILDSCRNQEYSAIIAGNNIMSLNQVEECIQEKYLLIESFENFDLFVPNNRLFKDLVEGNKVID